MKNWESVKLGDLYEVHNGLSKGGKFFGSGYPFLTFSTVFNNYFLPEELTDFVQSTEKNVRAIPSCVVTYSLQGQVKHPMN